LRFRSKDLGMNLLNMLQPEQLWEYVLNKEKMRDLIELARQAGVPLMIITSKPELEDQRGCVHEVVDIGRSYNLVNIYDVNATPEGIMNKGRAVLNLLHYGQSSKWCERVIETWSKRAEQKVNNMYAEEGTGQVWICPLCLQEGKVINKFYGQCLNKGCLVVTTAESIQDIRMGPGIKRKVETVTLWSEKQYTKIGASRCFFPDGSGKKVSQRTEAMLTGWAVVEVELRKDENLTMKIKNKLGAVSEEMMSVQWCEAKAILEAIKGCETGEIELIHTDSKGTIQQVRSLLCAPYKRKRKRKGKEIAQEIVQAVEGKELFVVLEWVKGHEDMHMEEVHHNWVSRLKMRGNCWADEAAKEVVDNENRLEKQGAKYIEPWPLMDAPSGVRINWVNLPKLIKLNLAHQRALRLSMPSKQCFRYGQGKYMNESRKGRSLAFKGLPRLSKRNEKWHYMALIFMMDKWITRDFA